MDSVTPNQVWRTIALMCVLGLVGFASWMFLPAQFCPVPDNLFTDEQLKLIRSADVSVSLDRPNCFEFWLNRYQTLITGAFAAVAAAIALRTLQYSQTQAVAASAQAAAAQAQTDAAIRQGYVISFEFYTNRLAQLKDIRSNYDAVIKVVSEFTGLSIVSSDHSEIREKIKRLDESIKAFDAVAKRFHWPDDTPVNRFYGNVRSVGTLINDGLNTYSTYASMHQFPPGWTIGRKNVWQLLRQDSLRNMIQSEIDMAMRELDEYSVKIIGEHYNFLITRGFRSKLAEQRLMNP